MGHNEWNSKPRGSGKGGSKREPTAGRAGAGRVPGVAKGQPTLRDMTIYLASLAVMAGLAAGAEFVGGGEGGLWFTLAGVGFAVNAAGVWFAALGAGKSLAGVRGTRVVAVIGITSAVMLASGGLSRLVPGLDLSLTFIYIGLFLEFVWLGWNGIFALGSQRWGRAAAVAAMVGGLGPGLAFFTSDLGLDDDVVVQVGFAVFVLGGMAWSVLMMVRAVRAA